MAALNGRRPVIGYTLEMDDSMLMEVELSLRAPLQQYGAMPLVLPRRSSPEHIDQVLDAIDGLLLSGGADVDPSYYGHERHELTRIAHEQEDAFEVELARRALDRGMPVMGVCRGIQVMAVADGGTLTQDVATLHPGAAEHRNRWRDQALDPPGDHWHRVQAEPGSGAERWLAGGEPSVNSFHHQCVSSTGGVLTPTAHGEDGVIEAIERSDGAGWAAGMQWHNEMMWRHDDRFLRPFAELVEAASAYHADRTDQAIA